MTRYLAAVAILAMVARSVVLAASFSEADMIGTWRADPSTYVVIVQGDAPSNFKGQALIINRDGALMATNLVGHQVVGPQQSMPTNYAAFALILKQDGSFVATNVPADLFFDWPAMAEANGKWYLQTNRLGKNEYLDFSLWFRKPSYGSWGGPVRWLQKESSSQRQPALHVFLSKSSGRQVCLTKQSGVDGTNAAPHSVTKQVNSKGEPDGAANGSQPIPSETNRTSSAAGSRR